MAGNVFSQRAWLCFGLRLGLRLRVARVVVSGLLVLMAAAVVPSPAAAQKGTQDVAAADRTASPTARVTLQLDDVPLRAAVREIARQAGLKPSYDPELIPSGARVTLHVTDISVDQAFEIALRGTGLSAHVQVTGNVLIVTSEPAGTGTIVGKVLNAVTGRPLRTAAVLLDGKVTHVPIREDGAFTIADVSPGPHHISVRLLGYGQQTRVVTVVEGEAARADFALSASINALDQVVVTGTVVATERKAIPTAISVVTAEDIERRGITEISDLFRGDIPGVVAANTGAANIYGAVAMYSRGIQANQIAQSVFYNTQPAIKTYVDGVELADPKYLNSIDPKSIERIEIIAGPEASTVYGSQALGGVMQIFTKHGQGRQRPTLTLTTATGIVQNDYSSGLAPRHNYNLQLDGGDGQFSYNVGGSYQYTGAWTPGYFSRTTGGYGSLRADYHPLTVSVMARASEQTNGAASLQLLVDKENSGQLTQIVSVPPAPVDGGSKQQSLGMTADYTMTSWWSHHLTVGQDQNNYDQFAQRATNSAPYDTLLVFSNNPSTRESVNYNTTLQGPIGSYARMTMTFGADYWSLNGMYLNTSVAGSTVGIISAPYGYNNQRVKDHNGGQFVQGQLALADALFLTAGVRAEENPNYGSQYGTNFAPRFGASLVHEFGLVTAKLRAAYGRATRPPTTDQKAEMFNTDATYGPYVSQAAAPDLGPEYQRGTEYGAELYVGSFGSVSVTHYDQHVQGLISQLLIDTLRYTTFPRLFTTQYFNLDDVHNYGWESQAAATWREFTLRGTWSDAISRSVSRDTRADLSTYNQYPEHTGSLELTYANAKTSINFGLSFIGPSASTQDPNSYVAILYSRLDADKPRLSLPPNYRTMVGGYNTANINVSQYISSHMQLLLQIENAGNYYRNDYQYSSPTIGRVTTLGARIRW